MSEVVEEAPMDEEALEDRSSESDELPETISNDTDPDSIIETPIATDPQDDNEVELDNPDLDDTDIVTPSGDNKMPSVKDGSGAEARERRPTYDRAELQKKFDEWYNEQRSEDEK